MARKPKPPANPIIELDSSLSLKAQILSVLQPQIDANKKLATFLTEVYFNKYYPTLLQQIKQYAIDNNITNYKNISELLYLIINDMSQQHKCTCGNIITTYISFHAGYNKYCSNKCASNDPDKIKRGIEKYKETVMAKYGVDNMSKLQSIKDKKVETMMANYGVAYNSQRAEIRQSNSDRMKTVIQQGKIKDGIIKSLGVNNPSLSQSSLDKRQDTFDNKKIDRFKEYAKTLNINYIKYTNDFDILFNCNKCSKDFNINYQLFHIRMDNHHPICTECNPTIKGTSIAEQELSDFIQSIYNGEIITNDRKLLNGKEVDIYLPELNLAIEFNGLYWHSEFEKHYKYHINKTQECKDKNIQLIHIFEDDWLYKKDIIKSRLLNKLNKSNIIYARKCDLKIVNMETTKQFLNNNHIQGWCISSVNIGLYYNDELVSIMTFGNRKISSKSQYELLRFCNKLNTTIVGGASKLFNHFVNFYNIDNIISYADMCWSSGNLYNQLNFVHIKNTEPNYWWVVDGIKTHRYKWRKQQLIKDNLLNAGETEAMCMHRLGHFRIYDCGSIIFEWNRPILHS